jgi:hypothetical protein
MLFAEGGCLARYCTPMKSLPIMFALEWLHCTQAGIKQLLAQPGITSGRSTANGNPLAVVALLERSFSQLSSDNQRCCLSMACGTVLCNN